MRAFVDEFVAAVGCRADYRDFTLYGEQPYPSSLARTKRHAPCHREAFLSCGVAVCP